MIKFEKQLIEDYEDLVDGGLSGCLKTPADLVKYVKDLLLRQIDEDNKRFLGMIGRNEKCVWKKPEYDRETGKKTGKILVTTSTLIQAQNELRQELRDKVNKK